MPSLIRYARSRVRSLRARFQKNKILKQGAPDEIARDSWEESLHNPTAFYQKCFRYFHTRFPPELRAHRAYFLAERRGFGEDAFHTMWFLLFREFKPRTFLEIGVYRGQTISLAALLQRNFAYAGEVAGISPFSSSGDSVSNYRSDLDYLLDTLANFAHFSLSKPTLLRAFSTDAPARELVASRTWDCVYIDGNHDYDIARQDWELCSRHIKVGGIIVLDDAGLTSTFSPLLFSTAGHPGPSRLAQEVDAKKFQKILQVGHNVVFQKIN